MHLFDTKYMFTIYIFLFPVSFFTHLLFIPELKFQWPKVWVHLIFLCRIKIQCPLRRLPFLLLVNKILLSYLFYAPTLRHEGIYFFYLVHPSVCSSENFVREVEEWGHLCSFGKFLVVILFCSSKIKRYMFNIHVLYNKYGWWMKKYFLFS